MPGAVLKIAPPSKEARRLGEERRAGSGLRGDGQA